MIWFLFRGLRNASFGGKPSGQGEPIPYHKPVVWFVAIASALACTYMFATGHLNNAMLTACIIVFSMLGLGSMLVGAFTSSHQAQARVRHLPDLVRPDDRQPSAAQLRERADQLSAVAVVERPARDALPPPPGRTAPTVPEPAPRKAQTYNQRLREADLNERMRRIAAILMATCPACGATGGEISIADVEACTVAEGEAASLLDRERNIIVHDRRIGKSVKLGYAKITDVTAQFESQVPQGVWEEAL